MSEEQPRTLATVQNTFRVVDALRQLEGAGVTELADHLSMSKGGVYNHLATLRRNEYVIKRGDQYELSFRFFNIGQFVKHQTTLYNISKPYLEELAREVDEHVVLLIEEFGMGIYLHRIQRQEGLSEEFTAKSIETPDHLHRSAAGKAILAHLPEARTEEIIEEHGLPGRTPDTITDRETLARELEVTRDRGYAINDEESISGTRAVGAPVRNHDQNIVGAISVTGPSSRMDDERVHKELPPLVTETANVIEVNMKTSEDNIRIRL